MITVIGLLMRAQSRRRLLVIAGCGAAGSMILLTALTMVLLPGQPDELLFDVVADADTRGGVVLALLLLLVPVLVLAYQVVLLGSTTRTRRLALLHVTGATPSQVRVLGAALPALPAGVGAVLGVPGFLLLRMVIGGMPADDVTFDSWSSGALRLIPVTVTPAWWQLAAIVVATTATVAAMGWRLSRSAITSAEEVVRRRPGRRPRPWGLIPIALGLGGFVGIMATGVDSTLTVLVLVGVGALGLLSIAPWIAYRAGTIVAGRATSVGTLLGSSRLVADPWTAGRAAAPITVIGLVAGGTGVIIALLLAEQMLEAFYLISILPVAILVLVGLIFVTSAITAHGVETLAENARPIAALAAAGTPESEIERSLTAEAAIVSYPSAAVGVLLGAFSLLGLQGYEDYQPYLAAGLVMTLGSLAAILGITRLAISAATRLVRPWLRQATSPANLRTE